MRLGRLPALAALLLLVASGFARAESFTIVGPRALGMGGAGVAVTRGSLSTYWNPAGLAPPRAPKLDSFFDLTLPVDLELSTSDNLLRDISEIVDLVDAVDLDAIESQFRNGQPLSESQSRTILRLIEELPDLDRGGTGLVTNANASLNLRVWRLGFTAGAMFYGGAQPTLDRSLLALGNSGVGSIPSNGNSPATADGVALANQLVGSGLVNAGQANEIAFQAEQAGVQVGDPDFQTLLTQVLQATVNNAGGDPNAILTANQSGVNLRAITVGEVGIGYAQPLGEILPLPVLDWISLGVTLKALFGTTYLRSANLESLRGVDDLVRELTDNASREESIRFGLDVGALVQPFDWLSFGLVAKNINEPEFDFASTRDYELEPQVRAGLGLIDLVPGFTFAVDVDLTRNQTDTLPGRRIQAIAGGLEYDLLDAEILFLRFGASQNLADTDDGVVLHGGLGLSFLGVSIEAAIAASPESSEVGDVLDIGQNEIPETARASIQIGINIPLP